VTSCVGWDKPSSTQSPTRLESTATAPRQNEAHHRVAVEARDEAKMKIRVRAAPCSAIVRSAIEVDKELLQLR
jgi:hypothetical protein